MVLLHHSTPQVSRFKKDLRKRSCRLVNQSTNIFTAIWVSQLNFYQLIIIDVPTGRSADVRSNSAPRETTSHPKETSVTTDPENRKHITAALYLEGYVGVGLSYNPCSRRQGIRDGSSLWHGHVNHRFDFQRGDPPSS